MQVKVRRRNLIEIDSMCPKPIPVKVYRNRKWEVIISSELVPGDLVAVGQQTGPAAVPADLLLLRGSCIVDEAMLTGESVPQSKEPVPTDKMDSVTLTDVPQPRRHLLFAGTSVVQVCRVCNNMHYIPSLPLACELM